MQSVLPDAVSAARCSQCCQMQSVSSSPPCSCNATPVSTAHVAGTGSQQWHDTALYSIKQRRNTVHNQHRNTVSIEEHQEYLFCKGERSKCPRQLIRLFRVGLSVHFNCSFVKLNCFACAIPVPAHVSQADQSNCKTVMTVWMHPPDTLPVTGAHWLYSTQSSHISTQSLFGHRPINFILLNQIFDQLKRRPRTLESIVRLSVTK